MKNTDRVARTTAPTHLGELRAALFDLDGTLVDTEPRSRWAWARLFAGHGVPLSDAELATFSGRRGQEVLAERLHLFHGHTVDELFTEAMGYWSIAEVPDAVPIPGAIELVRAARRGGAAMAIVSSGRRGDVANLLELLAVHTFFDVIITAEDVVLGKPDPEGFLTACDRLGVSPHEAVVFEDAPVGVAAAKRAGARCVAVTTNRSAAALAEADLVVGDLTAVSWPPVLRS